MYIIVYLSFQIFNKLSNIMLVRKNMDVNEHEKLSNITLRL